MSLDAPELDRFLRYAEAMAAAQVAELEPGDAIFIPYMWWHGVQALDPFNLLVNYWWNSPHEATGLHPTWALTLAGWRCARCRQSTGRYGSGCSIISSSPKAITRSPTCRRTPARF